MTKDGSREGRAKFSQSNFMGLGGSAQSASEPLKAVTAAAMSTLSTSPATLLALPF